MKKLLSLALALIMVLTLSVAVAAEDPADMTQVTIDVTYTATNTGTTSPEEDFSFTIAKTSVSDAAAGVTTENMPDVTVGGVAFTEGEAAQGGTMVKLTYEVVEADYTSEANGKYDAAKYDFTDTAKKIDSATDTVTITNNKGTGVDTGVVLDSLPYILLIAVALVGVVAFTAKKRTID